MRIGTYIAVSENEAQLLDKKLEQTPFESRTDFLTACPRVFLYGNSTDKTRTPGPLMENWLGNLHDAAAVREQIRETYFNLLHELAFPAIAMRGSRTAYRLLRKDLERGMLERCGMIPPAEEMEPLARIIRWITYTEVEIDD
ncbi:MAG: hypothetical protein LBL85_04285 [Methanocalculaceae archaeon]|jgi:hypothetical protein|nr:hypothetical protein [Methanocalculaceae archaeon]